MDIKRIVIKIGTHLLTTSEGTINRDYISQITSDIAQIYHKKHEIILVTSGAIGSGVGRLGLKERPKTLPEKQAASAIGQPLLMHYYEESFNKHNIIVSQVLLTREDFAHRERYLNVRNTLLTLLQLKVIPIINENDTVAVEEIQFGDNDTLSAIVAAKVEADLLIILTDVEGLYTADPHKDKTAKLITEVKTITPEIENIARRTVGSLTGTGGMYSKVHAAKIACASGTEVIICDGRKKGLLLDIIIASKKVGTSFYPAEKTLPARKKWIAFGTTPKGKITIDKGAAEAIVSSGKSLLPAGIISVEGTFAVGDTVSIIDIDGKEIARGLTYYSSDEVEKIKGKRTDEITKIILKADFEEVVHRNNLVIL